jgi:ribosomal protein S18 acetylase RimI-like enzyme
MPEVRAANIADCAAVEAIVRDAYSIYVARIGRKPGPMLVDYAALIRDQRVHVLDNDGVICGIVVLVPEDSSMLLANVAVRPDLQGQGYGRMLLEFAERSAFDAGHDSIRLYTHETMTENIALYSVIGFVETHRDEEDGFKRVYMTKRLR